MQSNKQKNVKTQKSQKSQTQNNNKARNQRRRRNNTSRKVGFASSAPAAVSDNLQQYVRFDRGRQANMLRVEACVPLYQIGSNYYSGSLVKGGLSLGPTTTFPMAALSAGGGYYTAGGTDSARDYISPAFKLQASTFVRYKVIKCEFVYEPQSPTDVADRLVFAYASDPEHPLIKKTPAAITQESLLALSDSVAFAPWRSWSLDVTRSVKQDLMYTFNQDTSGEADNRFNMFGAIGCLASVEPTGTTAQSVYGILYGRITFEFQEFAPIATTVSVTEAQLVKRGYVKLCTDKDCKRCSKPCKMCSISDSNNLSSKAKQDK